MNLKNIKIKLLFLYSIVVLVILSTFAVSVVYVFGDDMYETMEELEHVLFISIPLIGLLFVFVGWFIVNNVLKRVSNVIDEVNQIGINDLNKRLTLSSSNDEIEELIITFNTLLNRLDDSVMKIKRFSNDVSHELKTPLTVIRGEIELGLRKDRTKEEYKQILKSSLTESIQLQELIDSLFFLSNSNKQEIVSKFETLEIDEIIIDILSEYKQLVSEKNITIEFDSLENVFTLGDLLLVKIMIGNIIQNSIKYSNNNSKIIISLKNKTLSIKDFGIGIDQKNIKNIFDRFYRADESRGRGGYGLGLSIVKNISDIHNYTIDIKSELSKYTEVSINF